MLLAADTSSNITSAALLANGEVQEALFEGKQARSAQLFMQVDFLLESAGIGFNDLHCLALGAGPGSFTGLRISFSAFRALAETFDLPVVLVDSLEAMAHPYLALPGSVAVLQLARRGLAWCAFFQQGTRLAPDTCLDFSSLRTRLEQLEGPRHILGTAAPQLLETPLPQTMLLPGIDGPRAAAVACVGQKKFDAGEIVDWQQALPSYLLASDAEIKQQEVGNG